MVGGEAAMESGKEEMDAICAVLEDREAARGRKEPATAFEAAAPAGGRVVPEDVDADTAAHVSAMLGGSPDPHAAEPDTPPAISVDTTAADGEPAVCVHASTNATPAPRTTRIAEGNESATPADARPNPVPHLATPSGVLPARALEEQLATPTTVLGGGIALAI
jgi:hypothetical protein